MSDNKLLQNTLAEATTESGFPTITNTPLQREVTLETGETVIVEGIMPNKMAEILNSTFLTPGEIYETTNYEILNGVVQNFNGTQPAYSETIELTEGVTATITADDPDLSVEQIVSVIFNTGSESVTITFNDETFNIFNYSGVYKEFNSTIQTVLGLVNEATVSVAEIYTIEGNIQDDSNVSYTVSYFYESEDEIQNIRIELNNSYDYVIIVTLPDIANDWTCNSGINEVNIENTLSTVRTSLSSATFTPEEPIESDIVITSDKTVIADFLNFGTDLLTTLSGQVDNEIYTMQSDSNPFLEITGKDEFSTLEFYNSNNEAIVVKLGYKTVEDTGSSMIIANINYEGSQPDSGIYTLGEALTAIANYSADPVTIDISSIDTGISTFLKENTPLTTNFYEAESYSTTIDLKDYITVS